MREKSPSADEMCRLRRPPRFHLCPRRGDGNKGETGAAKRRRRDGARASTDVAAEWGAKLMTHFLSLLKTNIIIHNGRP